MQTQRNDESSQPKDGDKKMMQMEIPVEKSVRPEVTLCDCTKKQKYTVYLYPSISPDYISGTCDGCGQIHAKKVVKIVEQPK